MPRSRQPSDLVSLKSGAQCSGELPHLWVPLKATPFFTADIEEKENTEQLQEE